MRAPVTANVSVSTSNSALSWRALAMIVRMSPSGRITLRGSSASLIEARPASHARRLAIRSSFSAARFDAAFSALVVRLTFAGASSSVSWSRYWRNSRAVMATMRFSQVHPIGAPYPCNIADVTATDFEVGLVVVERIGDRRCRRARS
jgi:hypothetical protein